MHCVPLSWVSQGSRSSKLPSWGQLKIILWSRSSKGQDFLVCILNSQFISALISDTCFSGRHLQNITYNVKKIYLFSITSTTIRLIKKQACHLIQWQCHIKRKQLCKNKQIEISDKFLDAATHMLLLYCYGGGNHIGKGYGDVPWSLPLFSGQSPLPSLLLYRQCAALVPLVFNF